MKFSPYIFRAYDIRGEYKQDFDEETFYNIALAFAQQNPETKKIVVSMDVRHSGPSLKEAVSKGLMDSGIDVIDIGLSSTSVFYFTIVNYKYDGGFMITGSHLPSSQNGLKIQTKNAYPLISKNLEDLKERILNHDELIKNKPNSAKGRTTKYDPIDDYVEKLKTLVSIDKPLNIIIDTGNGAVGKVPERILKELGCKVETIFADFDGDFPNHVPDPYEDQNLVDLQNAVIEKKADLGVAFDCDGDRLGIIDSKGRKLSGDHILLLFGREALQKKQGHIAFETRTSKTVVDELTKLGAEVTFTIGHHKAILDEIMKKDSVFGGETTGHIYFPMDYFLVDDAIVAALKMIEIASNVDIYTELIDSLPKLEMTDEIFIDYPDETKFQAIKNLQDYLRENDYDFIDVDGARIHFEHGWGTIRAANTSPFIKVKFEADTREHLVEILVKAKEIMNNADIGLNIPKEYL